MKKYVKTYLDYFKFTISDKIICENCGDVAVDIHHIIFKSHSGLDNIENLIALCRNCHNLAHSNKEFNEKLKQKKAIEFAF